MSQESGARPPTGVKRTELQRAHSEVLGRLIVQTLFRDAARARAPAGRPVGGLAAAAERSGRRRCTA
jgi:hypothetical protein